MLDLDLLIAFFLMGLLFLRQITNLKKPNKINYVPLIIAFGVISSLLHFILSPPTQETMITIKESTIPLLISLLLYLVMNIIEQTQRSQTQREQNEFTHVLIKELDSLKDLLAQIEAKMIRNEQEEKVYQEDMRQKFKQDFKSLDTLDANSTQFLEKFDTLEKWHEKIHHSFESFVTEQLPELDDVIHKHIDILRVSEQEHYIKILQKIEKSLHERQGFDLDLKDLQKRLDAMQNLSEGIAESIVAHTLENMQGVLRAFNNQVTTLKSHAEAVNTTLFESENRLVAIKEQSEIVVQQMTLSSKKMEQVKEQHTILASLSNDVASLVDDIESIKADYVKSQAQLETLVKEMQFSETEYKEALQKQIDDLSEELQKKVDSSLAKLHEHYHIASEDITQSVKVLARKAQMQKGYGSQD